MSTIATRISVLAEHPTELPSAYFGTNAIDDWMAWVQEQPELVSGAMIRPAAGIRPSQHPLRAGAICDCCIVAMSHCMW